jgi:hypothetical protein
MMPTGPKGIETVSPRIIPLSSISIAVIISLIMSSKYKKL